ncbi:MAG: glycosyltransferase family 2 protein [Ruminococcus sp.]
MGIDISVIVPAYNCQETIKNCLDSILNQTIENRIEIVVVNDGSTDGTAQILSEYKDKHPDSVNVITQMNSGPAKARNNGILSASGKYIGFVDADDYIEPDMYELMLSRMADNTDLVVCGRYNIYEDVTKVYNSYGKFDGKAVDNTPALLSKISTYVWDKLFRKDVITDNCIMFPEDCHYAEDYYFLQSYILCGGRVAVVEKPLYHYVLANNNSVTGKCDQKWFDICKVLTRINEECISEGCFEQYRQELLLSAAGFYCRRIRTFKNYNNIVIPIRFVWRFIKYFNTFFEEDWKEVVFNHPIKAARQSRMSFVLMVKYIVKLRINNRNR